MTKKLVALVMALMMLLSVTALAETADTSDWETYNFEDAQLTISCPADMAADRGGHLLCYRRCGRLPVHGGV